MLLTLIANLGYAAGVVVPDIPIPVLIQEQHGGAKRIDILKKAREEQFLMEFLKTATDIINNQ